MADVTAIHGGCDEQASIHAVKQDVSPIEFQLNISRLVGIVAHEIPVKRPDVICTRLIRLPHWPFRDVGKGLGGGAVTGLQAAVGDIRARRSWFRPRLPP